ncbi:MAG: RIP metalloprotease RseP [Bacilli bacterium]|nr:RIP metalloprotease RseP [Bacilli bacterium]
MTLLSIIVFIFILGLIVLVHEFGHYMWARKFGVHIYEFSIGMGPVIFTHTGKDDIKYRLRLLPIGGFVQMAGEVYEDDNKIPKEKFMCNRPWHQRIIIIVAGVINNFILAIVLLFVYALIWGSPSDKPIISHVEKSYPMYEAGIRKDDLIVAINNKKVNSWDKAQILLVLKSKNNTYSIKVKHKNGEFDTYNIKPKKIYDEELKMDRYVFGFSVKEKVSKGFLSSVKFAFTKFIGVIETMWLTISNLFIGKLSLKNLSGPVGVYQVVNSGLSIGISYLIYITAFLSINVGFINILPFPAFDGGRAFFMLIEKIRRKPINSKIENTIHMIGFILLLILMLFITWQDILRLFK